MKIFGIGTETISVVRATIDDKGNTHKVIEVYKKSGTLVVGEEMENALAKLERNKVKINGSKSTE